MKHKHLILAFITTLFLSACGGGGGDSTPTPNVPATPGSITVTAGNAQIQPSWTAVSGATSYNTYYGTAAGVTTANGIKISGATSGAAITGLTNGTTYYVAVTAVNATGESALSSEARATPVAPPAAPNGVTATGGNTQVTVTWTNATGASSYNVYYGTTTGVTTASGTKITNATSGTAVTGLTNGTTYYFVVTAANAGGESAVSSEVNATPQVPVVAPAAPTGVSATAGDTQATISWSAVTGADSYNVYYGAAAGVTTANGTKVTGATSGSAVTGLVNGTAYYFVVTAVNVVGESVASGEVSTTSQAPATTFAMADLVGTWDRHRLQAGRTITDITTGAITSVTSNWNHGTETVDALGNSVNGVELTSNGNTSSGASSVWSLSADGIITDTADPSFHGTVSGSRDLIVGTRTAGNGIDPRLIVLQKQNPAITFATSDLAGTWDCHRLQAGRTFTDIAGVITGTTNNWNHNVEVWDANGNSITTEDLSSNGTSIFDNPANGNDPYTNSISPSGVVTTADPTQHGIMSPSKDLVVITRTAGNGIDVRLIVCQKRDPAITFTTVDLAGTWNRHRLQAGRTFTDMTTGAITSTTNNWNYGVDAVDSSGNITPGPELGSDGNTTPGTPSTWSVSANGIITDSGDASFHGTMSASKDLIVGTRTAGNGIDVRLIVYQRK